MSKIYRNENTLMYLHSEISKYMNWLRLGYINCYLFSRPKYRYPYYDENGVGRLLYGYGDEKLYQYKVFSPLEGIH